MGASPITYTQTVCPDTECQKQVDKGIADRKAKNASLLKAKEDAKLARGKIIV